ncbi:MAG TPA: GxxExxY protein [Tenuifilaceae bacterium]|nr:GxxExxY protein [Tenuifilaceae bacterium]HPE17184.1 GxxExxY protein [Tenuifilaceae bacterium]HPJ44768.1 GxxExxY protein [Tenuifilaceae bacterium]HPQ33296.1 GxxExxY protein [Tenuifilaceae bacterium]HRX67582.1 GxxExxY protein [Tenuifilaceae bacterium]
MLTKKYLNDLTYEIIGAAIDVHKEVGPGLLESIYEKCMIHVLNEKGIKVSSQQKVPVKFRGIYLDCDLRLDLIVEDLIIVEIKAVESFLPVHEAQLFTYLKLLEKPKGILLNFNSANIFNEGQKTMVTELFSKLPKGY